MKHFKLLFVLCAVLSVLSVFSLVSAQDLNPVSSEAESRFQTREIETREINHGGITLDIPAFFNIPDDRSDETDISFASSDRNYASTIDIMYTDLGFTEKAYIQTIQSTLDVLKLMLGIYYPDSEYAVYDELTIAENLPGYGYYANVGEFFSFVTDFYYKDGRSFTITLMSFDGEESLDFYREMLDNILDSVRF